MNQDLSSLQASESWAERNGFSDWALAMIWIIVALVLFQMTAGLVSILLLMATTGIDAEADFLSMITERLDLLFIGNSTGQILFLGLATWKVAGLHVSGSVKKQWMRFQVRENTVTMAGWALLLFIVVQPTVWYAGYLNSLIPLPDSFLEMQQSQAELIEQFLTSEGVLWMAVINIALIPSICEEVMFRGYVQGALEKSWGAWPGILVSGLLFGLFHMQLSNLFPLAMLGILLALVTWLSGSLIPAMGAHFINNGSAVLVAIYLPDLAFAELTPESAPPLWTLLASLLLSGLILRQLFLQSGRG
ncbi:MAG: CPBP family intramembrane glutamic endopeptidase [Balneolaceae bacterium]